MFEAASRVRSVAFHPIVAPTDAVADTPISRGQRPEWTSRARCRPFAGIADAPDSRPTSSSASSRGHSEDHARPGALDAGTTTRELSTRASRPHHRALPSTVDLARLQLQEAGNENGDDAQHQAWRLPADALWKACRQRARRSRRRSGDVQDLPRGRFDARQGHLPGGSWDCRSHRRNGALRLPARVHQARHRGHRTSPGTHRRMADQGLQQRVGHFCSVADPQEPDVPTTTRRSGPCGSPSRSGLRRWRERHHRPSRPASHGCHRPDDRRALPAANLTAGSLRDASSRRRNDAGPAGAAHRPGPRPFASLGDAPTALRPSCRCAAWRP